MRDEDMVRALLSSKRISPNNRLVLADYDKQLRTGFLSNKDRNFIRALYAWHEGQGEGASADAASVMEDVTAVSTVQTLRTRLHEAQQRIAALEGQIEVDHKRIALMENALHKLRSKTTENSTSSKGDDRFRHAKRSFARLFHPDHRHGSEIEQQIRAEMFKEFWVELEQIERNDC